MNGAPRINRVVVVGATGLVGAHLVELLSERDAVGQVVSVTRRPVDYESDKVQNEVIDFDNIQAHAELFKGDVLFSCLGTTLRQAGSIRAQRIVDFDYQHQIAKIAALNQVGHYLLVSSSGANATSRSQYLKMKGELENAVSGLGFSHLSIVQPSLLLGDRSHKRIAEDLGAVVFPALCRLPGFKQYKPIHGRQVARKLIELSVLRDSNVDQPAIEVLRLLEVFPNVEVFPDAD